ncbi:MAG: deoxynucleoside kinase [Trueperaceae bacterium]|nr:MAG: deoxynucleoside kinase [Trueperaceae bacterium]
MPYIVVEGPIGVGKTSLSRLLAGELDANLILEVVEENPFLSSFYLDPEAYAFKVQVYFLLSRYKQSLDLNQGMLFFDHTVSDYLFDKDFIFASMNLVKAEWELYQEIYRTLKPKLIRPDLVVYLRAQVDSLLKRIAKRGRPFEEPIQRSYLERLGEAYDAYFARYEGSLHVIDADHYDFVEDENDRQRLVSEIVERMRAA